MFIYFSFCKLYNFFFFREKNAKTRTTDEMQKLQKKDDALCQGVHQRALILKESADGTFSFSVPLSFLNRFFKLDILYPQKKLMVLVLNINPEAKFLIKSDSQTSNYTFEITEANVKLNYYSLESSFRSQWYSLINSQSILRVLPFKKETHFTISKGITVIWLPGITTYGILPESLIIFLVTAKAHVGEHKNRYAFHPWGVKSMQLMVGGGNHFQNGLFTNMDLSKKSSPHVKIWYENFLKIFPKTAEDISLEIFFHDFFLYCFEIYPRDNSTKYGDLSLLTTGSCDLSLHFKEPLKQDLVLYTLACHNMPIRINPLGLLL